MHDIWNPWHGCHKCSPGCEHCYMYALDKKREVRTPSDSVRLTKAMKYPLSKYRNGAYKIAPGERIRVNMTSDTFLEEADGWRDDMWNVIRQRPDVIFWLLTKRPERIMDCLPEDWGDGWENVCLNITCENQQMYDKRIGVFLNVPAKHKGLCLAPLLGPVDISSALDSGQIEDVSAGGENYDGCRPCDVAWVIRLSEACRDRKVNFTWYETGTKLIAGGRKYEIVTKQEQSESAFESGLNVFFGRPAYKLYSLDDGHLLTKDELYKRQYNEAHCLRCSSADTCNGCSDCGNCMVCRLMSEKDFMKYRKKYMDTHSPWAADSWQ